MPKGKALIDALRALPKEAFADAMPPTTAKDWEDAEQFIPLSRVPTKKVRRQPIAETPESRTELAKTRKSKRA